MKVLYFLLDSGGGNNPPKQVRYSVTKTKNRTLEQMIEEAKPVVLRFHPQYKEPRYDKFCMN